MTANIVGEETLYGKKITYSLEGPNHGTLEHTVKEDVKQATSYGNDFFKNGPLGSIENVSIHYTINGGYNNVVGNNDTPIYVDINGGVNNVGYFEGELSSGIFC